MWPAEAFLKAAAKALLVACFALPTLIAFASESEWKTFTSEKAHFTVRYPGAWHRLDDEPGSLFIGNFPPSKRLKGVVIPNHAATLSVLCAPPGISTISQWLPIAPEPLSKQEISRLPRESGGCEQLIKVETEGEVGPNTYTHETSFYCSAGSRVFEVGLVNWRADRKQTQLQQIALKMALSLRTW